MHEATLDHFARGELSAGLAAMRLMLMLTDLTQLQALLDRHEALGLKVDEIRALIRPQTRTLVQSIATAVDHQRADDPQAWGRAFDRAFAISPEAAVALYCLGDPDRLAAETAETAGWLLRQGLFARRPKVLEIGCGVGRFVQALAPYAGAIVGLEVSAAMAAEARRRTRGCPETMIIRSDGRDLAAFASASFDLILAIDSFPYLVKAGVAEVHLAEAQRVLRPGGELVILNWAYEAPYEPPPTSGLEPVPLSGDQLPVWDGVSFRFRKHAQRV